MGHNIELSSDGSGNNFLDVFAGANGSSYLSIVRGSDNLGAATVSMSPFTSTLNPTQASWVIGLRANVLTSNNNYEIVQTGSNGLLLQYFTAMSIDADDLGATFRNDADFTLTLENLSNPASLMIKSYENGFGGSSDYAGFEFAANGSGSALELFARSFDDTGAGPISSIAKLLEIQSDGDIEISRNAVFNTLEVGPRFDALGLDGDVIPFANTAFDLGNNAQLEHWDDVVANEFVTYSDARLKHRVRTLEYGLDHVLQLQPVRYKYNDDLDEEKDYLGLIAQDVREIIPEVVASHDTDVDSTGQLVRKKMDYLGINYVALVPVLIRSVQEQQKQIEELKVKNANLLTRLERIEKHLELESEEPQTIRLSGKAGVLGQNYPNPATMETLISYSLAHADQRAEIRVFDQRGRLLQTIALPQKEGQGEVRLLVHDLPAATYSYSLYVGDKLADTRSLIVH